MVKWAMELSEYDLGYQPRTAIKTQALADFIADGVSFGSPEAEVDLARDIQARKDGEIVKDAHIRQAAKTLQTPKTTKVTQAREAAEVFEAGDAAEVTQAIQVAEVGPSKETNEAEQVKETAEGGQAGEAAKAKQIQKTAEVGPAGEAAEGGQALNVAEAEHSGKAVKAELARETAQARKVTEAAGRADLTWTLYVDGASSKEGCGAGLLFISPTREELPYALRFDFRASNNESEYETLITGMEMARKLGARSIKAYSDSQLIVNQVWGSYEVKEGTLRRYVAKTRELKGLFEHFALEPIPRSQNKRADALSKLASTSAGVVGREVRVEVA